MTRLLTRPAVFGVGYRDQIVDEIYGANSGAFHPLLEPGIVKTGVADVEIVPTATSVFPAGSRLYQFSDERQSNASVRTGQDSEQFSRILTAQDSPVSPMLDDGLCVFPEMVEIGQADSIDPGRMTPRPTTPDQAGDVE